MPKGHLEYHREDSLQEFDRLNEKTRNDLNAEQHKKHFSPKRQWVVFGFGLLLLIVGIVGGNRYGLTHYFGEWTSNAPIVEVLPGMVIIFFSLRNIIRAKRKD